MIEDMELSITVCMYVQSRGVYGWKRCGEDWVKNKKKKERKRKKGKKPWKELGATVGGRGRRVD